MRQPEGDARDGRGGVLAYASQLPDGRVIAWEAGGRDYLPSGLLHVARPRVVSEAAPQRQDLCLRCQGEILDSGEAF